MAQDPVTSCLWFDGNAEEAAQFYVNLFPNSRIDSVETSPLDIPTTSKGGVLIVRFTLNGRSFLGLNGGPGFPFTEAVSFSIDCADQAEVDHYWHALTRNGGAEVECGWCRDKFGLLWQVVPRTLTNYMTGPDQAVAARVMQAMLTMKKIDVAAIEAAAIAR